MVIICYLYTVGNNNYIILIAEAGCTYAYACTHACTGLGGEKIDRVM